MNYSISDYPLVIDPVVSAIEVHVAPHGAEGGKAGWREFVRIQIDGTDGHHNLPFVPTQHKVHLFGDGTTLATSNMLLVYGYRGGINCLLHRNSERPKNWETLDLPEEFTGYAVKPSLRLCFDSREACSEAMQLFDNLRTAYAQGQAVLGHAEKLAKLLTMNPEMIYAQVLKGAPTKC